MVNPHYVVNKLLNTDGVETYSQQFRVVGDVDEENVLNYIEKHLDTIIRKYRSEVITIE